MTSASVDLATLGQLLDEALDLTPDEFETWAAALDGDALRLMPRVRAMFERHRSQTHASYLSRGPALKGEVKDETLPRDGERVGPYRLLREIGHGGMGTVWLAERVEGGLKRLVALKLPRLMWGAGLADRMARERDIGALLEHPHIVRMYDAGVDAAGRPFLALEYVDGLPLDQWCDRHADADVPRDCVSSCRSSVRSRMRTVASWSIAT